MEQELIPEKMPGRKFIVPVELVAAERLIGIRAHYIGIAIYTMYPYVPPPGPTDEYQGVRKWYRKNIEDMGGMAILHRSDIQQSLAKSQADALDYLVTDDEEVRAKHADWHEPLNEAVEISQWIFPANAVNKAVVAHDFRYEIIIVSIKKNDREIDRIYYFVDPREHTLTYSHHFRGRKPKPQT